MSALTVWKFQSAEGAEAMETLLKSLLFSRPCLCLSPFPLRPSEQTERP